MTRAERLAKAETRAKEALETQRKALAKIQAQQYAEEKKALAKRRHLVGELVERAGLFALSDTVLSELFTVLAPLVTTPDPVAVLEGLLSDGVDSPVSVVHGCAHPTDGVPPAVSLG